MTQPLCDRYSSEKDETYQGYLDIPFYNIDGVPFFTERIFFWYTAIADEMFVACNRPALIVQEYSREEIYRQDIIITIQDHYKLKVKELNWL